MIAKNCSEKMAFDQIRNNLSSHHDQHLYFLINYSVNNILHVAEKSHQEDL